MPFDFSSLNAESLSPKLEDYDDLNKKEPKMEPENRFKSNKPTDVWAAVIFFLHLGVTGAYGIGGSIAYYFGYEVTDQPLLTGQSGIIIAACCAGSVVVGLLVASFFFLLSLKAPKALIWMSFIVYSLLIIAQCVLFAVFCFMYPSLLSILSFLLSLILLIIPVVLFFVVKKSLPLMIAYFEVASEVFMKFKGIILIFVITLGAYAVFTAFMIAVVVLTSFYNYYVFLVGLFWILFSWIWTTCAVTGIARTSVAGVVGRWYFDDEMSAGRVIFESFKRSITTSFGSICFGTFITAALNFIKIVLRIGIQMNANRRPDNCAQCLIQCFISCILIVAWSIFQRLSFLMRFFNTYAFCFLAIFGMNYKDAGKNTMKVILVAGLEAVTNNLAITLIAICQYLILCILSVATTSLGLYLSSFYYTEPSNEHNFSALYSTVYVTSFFLALGIGMISTEIYAFSIPAILVCSATEPSRMADKLPELLHLLRTNFPGIRLFRNNLLESSPSGSDRSGHQTSTPPTYVPETNNIAYPAPPSGFEDPYNNGTNLSKY